MKDLLGHDVTLEEARALVKKRRTIPKGYAAPPGTGPAGQTCKTCSHSYPTGNCRRTYWKCDLVKMTHGPGTDILIKAPACKFWRLKAA